MPRTDAGSIGTHHFRQSYHDGPESFRPTHRRSSTWPPDSGCALPALPTIQENATFDGGKRPRQSRDVPLDVCPERHSGALLVLYETASCMEMMIRLYHPWILLFTAIVHTLLGPSATAELAQEVDTAHTIPTNEVEICIEEDLAWPNGMDSHARNAMSSQNSSDCGWHLRRLFVAKQPVCPGLSFTWTNQRRLGNKCEHTRGACRGVLQPLLRERVSACRRPLSPFSAGKASLAAKSLSLGL